MDLEIYLTLKKPLDISLSEIIVLSLLVHEDYKAIHSIHMNTTTNIIEMIESLEKKGYVKLIDTFIDEDRGVFYLESASLRDKALQLFDEEKIDLNELVKKYRALFPIGYKGDLQGCKTKMKSFIRKYKKYTPEIILQVTEVYNNFITNGNSYRKQADNFIIKSGSSGLAEYCERHETNTLPKITISDNTIRL